MYFKNIKYFFPILILFLILFSYCANNQHKAEIDKIDNIIKDSLFVSDFEDLVYKYSVLSVTNCEEMLQLAQEYEKIYFTTIDNAYAGNEKSRSDFVDFKYFKVKFDSIYDSISYLCPDVYENWKNNFNNKLQSYLYKIDSLYKLDTLQYNYKEINDEIYQNLNKQLQEYKEDMKKYLFDTILEDTSKNAKS